MERFDIWLDAKTLSTNKCVGVDFGYIATCKIQKIRKYGNF